MNNLKKREILNVIENLKSKVEEIEKLSQERDLSKEELRELARVFEALELMQLELPSRPLTLQFVN